MSKNFLGFAWATIVILLTGCSSLHDKAEKHYLAEEFLAASALYTEILQKNSNDPVAIERLKRSRQHLIQDRLIEVRQTRLSDNYLEALDKLSGILKDEAEWQISPSGVAFATQTEEADLLFSWITRQAKIDLENKKYLKAKLFIDQFRIVFSTGTIRKKYEQLTAQIGSNGKNHCDSLKKMGAGPYSNEFVSRYCLLWGKVDNLSDRAPSAVPNGVTRFGQIELSGEIHNLPKEVLSSLSESLLTGLKKTPFYNANSPVLKVTLDGEFASKYIERPIVSVHSYQIQVPYQVMVTVPILENEPYTAYRTQYNFQTGQSWQEPYTAYRLVTRYQQQMITRYREEARSQPYTATEFNLGYLLVGKVSANLDGSTHRIPLDDQLNLTDTYHDTENEAIGLHAKPKDAPSAVDWIKDKFNGSGDKFSLRIVEAWDSRYCQIPKNLLEKTQIETVMKCIKGTKTSHEFVENWFQAKFGLSFDTVNSAIGFGS